MSTIASNDAEFLKSIPLVGTPTAGQVWVLHADGNSYIPSTPATAESYNAAAITVSTTGFGGILSAADSNVQLALSTIDDHGHTYAWQHNRSHALNSGSDHTGTITAAQHGSLGSGANHTTDQDAVARTSVQKNGSLVASRRVLDVVEGSGMTVTMTDGPGEVLHMTFASTGGVATHEITYDHTLLHARQHAISSGTDHTGALGASQHGALDDGTHSNDQPCNARLEILVNGVSIGTRRGLNLSEGPYIDIAATDNGGNERVDLAITGVPGAGGGDVGGPSGATDQAIVRYFGTTGKIIQDSSATIDNNGSVNIPTGQTYKINGVSHRHTNLDVSGSLYEAALTAGVNKVAVSDASGKLNSWISDAAAGTKGLIQLAGQISGTAASPTCVGLTVTGPVALAMGAVADGEFLKRSGTDIIGASAGGSSPEQIVWGALIGTNGTDFNGYSFRIALGLPYLGAGFAVGGNQVRVLLKAEATHNTVLDHVSIVERDGTTDDGTGAPTELLFSSASGVTLTAGTDGTWSDWTSFTFGFATDKIVICDHTAAASYVKYGSSTNATTYYKAGTASYNTQTVSGFSPLATYAYTVVAVQVRTV